MSQTVISVEHLSKTYRLGQIGTGTLTNDMKVWWAKKLGKPNPMLKIGQTDHGNMDREILWALKDVSFTVEQGEVLGIIGRNGAGKSTLLKILSRVTAPSSGMVKVKGRIASLLEVGTGFHPDLTGKENIYLNGAILGMSKQEIARKFDEIVAFAEIEKFIDTPVKRYSSGMYVRLAFAVAAHLESEILLVDEVLAVGDAEFQKKCLGKMGDVASNEGRTVLFVSHNLAAVNSLCKNGIILESGRNIFSADIARVINKYGQTSMNEQFSTSKIIDFRNVKVICEEKSQIIPDNPFIVSCEIYISDRILDYKLFCIIQDTDGQIIVHSDEKNQKNLPSICNPGQYLISVNFPGLWLKPGLYSVFFKLITASGVKGYARFLSNNLLVNINYEVPPEMQLGNLTPSLQWEISPLLRTRNEF
jgi:lipopolysaccharide transport system ATP-binding protein